MVSGTGKYSGIVPWLRSKAVRAARNVAPRVLVVDDESYARTTVCRWLTRAGFQCGEAASAGEAMARLQDQEAHLLTLDITVPDRSGLEVLSQIKQRWPDTEVLVLTALEETATAVEAMTLGAYGYLLKPIESGELIFQAKKALERRDLIVERRQYTATLEAKVREQMQAIRRAHEETILRLLSASRYRDEETGAHIKRTGLYCELFAEVLGWPADQVQNIRLAAPMHDLGKIGIPDAILQKPGKLTAGRIRGDEDPYGHRRADAGRVGVGHLADGPRNRHGAP